MRRPQYVIHRKGFPDGREEYRVEVGRFLFWPVWLTEGVEGFIPGEYGNEIRTFNNRASAELAIRLHWRTYISSLPAMMRETISYDPEAHDA